MSRRKQENPQPRKRLVTRVDCLVNSTPASGNRGSAGINQIKSEPEVLQDILTCGVCQKDFALSDIVKFIQHKVQSCNKENYLLYAEHEDYDSDPHEHHGSNGGASLPIVHARRPSISAPMARRDRTTALCMPLSTTPSPHAESKPDAPSPHSAFGDDGLPHGLHLHSHHHHHHRHHQRKLQAPDAHALDRESPLQRVHKPRQVDAESNTTYTEPNNYVCSTCKHSFVSAWTLLQHVQNLHGMKIYVDGGSSSSLGPGSPVPPSPSVSDHHSSHRSQPPQPPTPQPPPHPPPPPPHPPQPGQGPPPHPPHLPLEPHPFLLRLPLAERQFSPALNAHNPFVRPSSHDFRMELLSNQFRLHSPGLPGLPPFEHHHPFERPSLLDRPRFSLPAIEPLDFYSKRLRELAGTTSPATSPSPRKLTPPFSSPQPPPTSSQPSTPQPPLAPLTPTSTSTAATPLSQRGGAEGHHGTPKMKSCEFCGKTFRFQSNLIVHRRSHTGEKPYKCHICNHACTQASKLKRHMKTHQHKSPGSTVSENTSVESASSTPDSSGKRKYNHLEEEGSGSADTGGEEEDELEEEDDEELLDDDELGSEAAEDLSTSAKSGVSTPLLGHANGTRHLHPGNGPHERQSLLGEVMDKIGLSTIQHYSEAYKQALEESNATRSIKEENRLLAEALQDAHRGPGLGVENGLRGLHDDKGYGGPLDLVHPGPLGAFDSLFGSSKRIKLELGDGPRERDSLYAGLWLPAVAAPRDIFMGIPGGGGGDADHLGHHKHSSESALKALGLPDANSPKPGPSGGGSALLGCGDGRHHHHHHHGNGGPLPVLSPGLLAKAPKEQRRNDTCEYCGKVFKNCSNLTVHRRSHTGEKPYKCELCSYACAQSSKLTRHMKTHGRLGKDVYRCRFCDMPFSVPSTLEKHMRKCVVNQNIKATGASETDTDSKEAT